MNKTLIIAAREYTERIKQKGFIIGTLLGVLLIVAISLMSVIFGVLSQAFSTNIVIVAPDHRVSETVRKALQKSDSTYRLSEAPQPSAGRQLPSSLRADLESKKYDAALVAYYDAQHDLAFVYYPQQSNGLDKASSIKDGLLSAVIQIDGARNPSLHPQKILNFPFTTVNLNKHYKNAEEQTRSQLLVYFLLFLMYISVILYGIYVAQGVIEEKSNRVMELMIGAVRPSQLLAGKIAGIGSLALTQLVVIGLASLAINALAAAAFGQQLLHAMPSSAAGGPGSSGPAIGILTVPLMSWVYLVIFFVLGFFTYATMFAGVGALASKPEDLQQTSSFFTFPIIIAYFLSLFVLIDPEKPISVWGSLIPMLSPMVMFARVATSEVPLWQVLVSILASLATIWLFTQMAGKLYRVGVLMYGKPLAPKEILSALRSHT